MTKAPDKGPGSGEPVEVGVKYLDPAEFVSEGYLHEVNRKFLHPLGLALSVHTDEFGTHLGDIWDYRDDPEGLRFDDASLDPEKVANVEAQYWRVKGPREKLFGWMIQPAGPTTE